MEGGRERGEEETEWGGGNRERGGRERGRKEAVFWGIFFKEI